MSAPQVVRRPDADLKVLFVTVSGDMTTCDAVSHLAHVLDDLPAGYSAIVELDAMTTLTAASLGCLRTLATDSIARGLRLVLVSESIDVRANLILADLDSLAPVLHNVDQATRIIAAAA